MDLCKRLLGVKITTCNVMMYVELGRYPLGANRIFNMIKYWCKLLTINSCILKSCYDTLYDMSELQNCKNWATGVTDKRMDMDKSYLPIIKQRIIDQELQTIMGKMGLLQMFTV
jgi:hypothetical protein